MREERQVRSRGADNISRGSLRDPVPSRRRGGEGKGRDREKGRRGEGRGR
jgi:hypothetical protein